MAEMTDQELIDFIVLCEAKKSEAEATLKKLKHELLARRETEIESLYKGKDEPYGDVTTEFAGKRIKLTRPKKVEWDQDKLKSLASQIVADGGEVSDYIDIEYNIPEKRWSAWGNNITSHFIDARTVTPGNLSIKVIEEKE